MYIFFSHTHTYKHTQYAKCSRMFYHLCMMKFYEHVYTLCAYKCLCQCACSFESECVSVWVCECSLYAYIHNYIHTHTQPHAHVLTRVVSNMHVHNTFLCICILMCIYAQKDVCVCVKIHTWSVTNTHMQKMHASFMNTTYQISHMHTYIHAYVCLRRCIYHS